MLGSKKAILALHKELKTLKESKPYGKYSNWYWKYGEDSKTAKPNNYKDGLVNLLLELELSLGGHGNGLALVHDAEGQNVTLTKGTSLETESCAEQLLTADYRFAVFHTRLASAGDISDRNCHPYHFYTKRKKGRTDLLIAQNGTESPFSFGTFYGGKTDCEAIARIVLSLGLPIPKTFAHFGSVFVGTKNGRPFYSSGRGDLRQYNHKELLVCSELPRSISEDVPSNIVWYDGKTIYTKPQPTTTRTYHYTYTPDDDYCAEAYLTPKPYLRETRSDPYIDEEKKHWTPSEISLYERTGITPYDTD
jgi:hypothetical protein